MNQAHQESLVQVQSLSSSSSSSSSGPSTEGTHSAHSPASYVKSLEEACVCAKRLASNGQELCLFCPAIMKKKTDKYSIGTGHYCNQCYRRIRNGERPPLITFKSAESKENIDRKRKMTETDHTPSRPSKKPKTLQPFELIKKSQQFKRVAATRRYCYSQGVPLCSLSSKDRVPLSNLLHLSRAQRYVLRSVNHFQHQVPCETTFNKFRQQLAQSQHTKTMTFSLGSFICDPIAFIKLVTVQSDFIAIGGDHGGGSTKIGITYTTIQQKQTFLPIIIMNDTDSYSALSKLRSNIITFEGESSRFPDIFSLLQHIINTHSNAFLNGDWAFINTIVGLKSASSTNPCFCCVAKRENKSLLDAYTSRGLRTPQFSPSKHPDRQPLIQIHPTRIIPSPLHVFLGISNKIISSVLVKLFGKPNVDKMKATVKQTHGPGFGGKADLWDLNGMELTHWLKNQCTTTLLTDHSPTLDPRTVVIAKKMDEWMRNLHSHLFHTARFTSHEITTLSILINDIHTNWIGFTGLDVLPKVHMLHHIRAFVENHRYLGKFSEAAIESCHANLNPKIHIEGRNCGKDTNERFRRAQARVVLLQLQPILL